MHGIQRLSERLNGGRGKPVSAKYLVRDVLTGRLLNAENVRESGALRLKEVLAPVLGMSVPVLGTMSDAQESEVMALNSLWPDVPHQTCQFHALDKASRPIGTEDKRDSKQKCEVQ